MDERSKHSVPGKIAFQLENEVELIKGCRAGEDFARKRLYTLYAKQMLAVCYRYTGDMDAAHDVLHDGFIKIFTCFSFRGESSLRTWITKVMVTHSLDYLRRQKRMREMVVFDEHLPDIPDLPQEAGDTGEIPEEKLMEFVAELPEGCRTVFNLYVFENKSHKEIGELLRIKENSSTSQLRRARFLLAKRIKEYVSYEERK
jgi:RNA polymerase sigma-70 factor (ECF subfamily)